MIIDFSEKYEPLFELLENKYPEVEIVLISGGRDSGKTFGVGCFVGIATSSMIAMMFLQKSSFAILNLLLLKLWMRSLM